MFDIDFFQNTYQIKKDIMSKKFKGSSEEPFDLFEKYRNRVPFVFNIETTNNCNLKCIMCPRTKLMSRKIEVMEKSLFLKAIDQIKPLPSKKIKTFFKFVRENYGIESWHRNENAFYFYIVSTHLILHGYGEPLLDPYIVERVKLCTARNIPTYMSCAAANIEINKIRELMKAGLGVIKFSLEGLSTESLSRAMGRDINFNEVHKKILQVIDIKEKNNFDTKIAVILIDLSNDSNSLKEKESFKQLWQNRSVFTYVKSQDNKWFYEENNSSLAHSHYEKQYCEFPWTSLTVMVDGSVVPCTQDYNAEMSLGNVRDDALKDIWNGKKYSDFRKVHIDGSHSNELKCFSRCDIRLICQRINSTIKINK